MYDRHLRHRPRRWRQGSVIVDVMPTDASVLGFSNRWYPMAIATAQRLDIAGHAARIVTPALFIATKLEAFHGRGHDDVFASHDLEDIITVVDGRPEIVDDVAAADEQPVPTSRRTFDRFWTTRISWRRWLAASCPMPPARLDGPS